MAMAAASCFFSAFTLFVSVILFPPGFPVLWETLSSSRFVFTTDLTGNISCLVVQDVQNNRPQTRALHALSLHSQLLSEANGRSAHSEIKIHPIANKFA